MSNLIRCNSQKFFPKSFFVLQPFGDDSSRLQSLLEGIKAVDSEPKEAQVKSSAYIFPGQGSQFKGMGGELFRHFPELCSNADAILGYSIQELCLNDPDRKLSYTQYTQPAIYVVSALTYLHQLQQGARDDGCR